MSDRNDILNMSEHFEKRQALSTTVPIIRRLNDSVKAKIHSSTSIASICGCVRELVYNSLDAGATHITVKLDIVKYFVQVTDNGCGINHDDLIVLGGKNFTSKCHSVQELNSIRSMGFKGEALSSICELTGTMEVCSRHQLSSETWCKLFHYGRDLGVTHSTAHRQGARAGTTVTLHDIFYSMPVRRKCIKESLEAEYIRQMVQHTAIVNPHIAFVVENSTTGACILLSRKAQSSMEKLSHFYSPSVTKTMLPVECCTGPYHVSGYVSTEMYPSKSLQLVYVNNRLVSQTQVHSLLNTLLTSRHKSGEHGHPVYFITIRCPLSECDFCWQPSKTLVEFLDWTAVLKATSLAAKNTTSHTLRCLDTPTQDLAGSYTMGTCPENTEESTSIHFSHGMQSDVVRKCRKNTSTSTTTSMPQNFDDSKDDAAAGVTPKFIGVKSASRSPLHTPSIAQKLAKLTNGQMEQGSNKGLSKKRANSHFASSKLAKHFVPDTLDSPFVPQDHSTPLQDVQAFNTTCKSRGLVAEPNNDTLKTGDGSMNFCSRPLLAAPHLSHSTSPFTSHSKRISFSLKSQPSQAPGKDSEGVSYKPAIIEKLVSEWNNPVFKTGQEHILAASTCDSDAISIYNMIHSYRFTKDMFHRIKVINQVDNKFIACLMDTKSNGSYNLLVLVDQHAAHERIRLEELIAELYDKETYCGNVSGRQVLSTPIEPPLKLQLNSQQLQLAMTAFSKQLKTVGIELSQVNNTILVHKLPSVLVNKQCANVPTSTIKEMIREHVEHLMTTGGSSCSIPRVLTDVLATQACHGAIKFNDPLTTDECCKLLESLSHCKLPFQCAHGRPSLVPVLDVGLLDKKQNLAKNVTAIVNINNSLSFNMYKAT